MRYALEPLFSATEGWGEDFKKWSQKKRLHILFFTAFQSYDLVLFCMLCKQGGPHWYGTQLSQSEDTTGLTSSTHNTTQTVNNWFEQWEFIEKSTANNRKHWENKESHQNELFRSLKRNYRALQYTFIKAEHHNPKVCVLFWPVSRANIAHPTLFIELYFSQHTIYRSQFIFKGLITLFLSSRSLAK